MSKNILRALTKIYKKEEKIKFEGKEFAPLSLIDISTTISLEKKFLFSWVYKAANSSVISSLYFHETGKKVVGAVEIQPIKDNFFPRPSQLSRREREELKYFYKFTFTRNPYARIVSSYLDKVQRKHSLQRQLVVNRLKLDEDSDISFDQFLHYLEQGGIDENGHWTPQYNFLLFPVERYDFLGRVENFEKDLSFVLNSIYGEAKELVNVVDHATDSSIKINDLSSEQKRRIEKLYAQDFDLFEYSFNS